MTQQIVTMLPGTTLFCLSRPKEAGIDAAKPTVRPKAD